MILVNGVIKMGWIKYNKVSLQKREMRSQSKQMSRRSTGDQSGSKGKKVNFHIFIQLKIRSKKQLIMIFLKNRSMQPKIWIMKNHLIKLTTMTATFYKKKMKKSTSKVCNLNRWWKIFSKFVHWNSEQEEGLNLRKQWSCK
jgi:hypothetical protein